MQQTKPRLNNFDQPFFLRPKKPVDTFWDEDDIRPFRLSIPEHFNPSAPKVFQQKQNIDPVRNYPPHRENRPANRQQPNKQQQKRHAQKPRTFADRQSESYIYNRPHSTLVSYFVQKIYTNWIAKELYFSMSKLSFLVLIIGLFFLSSLLFITGFLVAVNIYDIGAPKVPPITNMNIPYPSVPTIETPSPLVSPPVVMPGIPTTSMPGLPLTAPAVAMPQAAPNPNIMKMGMQGSQMADTSIISTARMPSTYAQPTQTLPPPPQPMPQSGGRYISSYQQAPVAQHMPSQGYTQQPNPYPQQTAPIQAPPQQHYTQPYPSQANQPAPQNYPSNNPGAFYQTGAR